MRRRFLNKPLVWFVCISVSLLTGGFHQWVSEAAEGVPFLGGMVSRGEVKFEERKDVWQNVESSYFPIPKGIKIRTEKGSALITLTNRVRVEMGQNSLLSLIREDRIVLIKGHLSFWIPPTLEIHLAVGNLSLTPSRTHQAAKGILADRSRADATIGSIYIHANGQVTVRSLQGNLTILNQNGQFVALVPPKDSITVPSIDTGAMKVAQADDEAISETAKKETIRPWKWIGIGAGVVAVAAGIALAAGGGGGGDHEAPVCP